MLCSNYSRLTLQGQLNSQDLNISGIFVDSEHEVPNLIPLASIRKITQSQKDENDHYDKQSLLASELLRPKNLEMSLILLSQLTRISSFIRLTLVKRG